MVAATPVLDLRALRYVRAPVAVGESAFAVRVEALTLTRGQAIGIVGPSGCGKSTLLDLFALLRRPSAVEAFELAGEDIAALWRRNAVEACTGVRARHIGVVLQTGGLLPSLSVADNIRLSQQLLGAPDEAHARALLDALDLSGLGVRLPQQLSIGQRQRVAIARALAHRPALVLADEPTASLGIDHADAALDLLLALSREHGSALVIVSHDVDLLRAHGMPLWHCLAEGAGSVLTAPRHDREGAPA